MMTFSLWKQLKKKLKRKRRPLWSMCAATAVLMAVIILLATAEHTMAMHIANGRSTSHLEPAHDKSVLQKLEQTEGDKRDREMKAFAEVITGIKKLGLQADKTLETLIKAEENWFISNLTKIFR